MRVSINAKLVLYKLSPQCPLGKENVEGGGGWDATLMKGQEGMRALAQLAKKICILRWSNLCSAMQERNASKILWQT